MIAEVAFTGSRAIQRSGARNNESTPTEVITKAKNQEISEIIVDGEKLTIIRPHRCQRRC